MTTNNQQDDKMRRLTLHLGYAGKYKHMHMQAAFDEGYAAALASREQAAQDHIGDVTEMVGTQQPEAAVGDWPTMPDGRPIFGGRKRLVHKKLSSCYCAHSSQPTRPNHHTGWR